ncbi:MAG: SDR family NAD(P)-dependent oxidoreductase [Promethearchaeota archaeon]
MGKLDGKVALIAGGMGRFKKEEYKPGLSTYIAQNFIAEGADVVIVDLDEKVTKACADYIGSPKVKAKACDILKDRTYETKTYETERGPKTDVVWTDNPTLSLVKEIIEEYGKLDALVMNFDNYEKGRVDSVTEETYIQLREQNVMPVFHFLAAVREQFSAQKKTTGTFAKVVTVTSMVGKSGMETAAVYSAFKGSMVALTKSMCREFGRFATVNAVALGPLSVKNMQGPKDRVKGKFLVTKSDMANIEIKPSHVAPLVTFLCSDDAAAISGQTISIDGGLWLKLEQ